MKERIITTEITKPDGDLDVQLRPNSLGSFIGQESLKKKIEIYIKAAKQRGETLDHVLLYGPPGLGKTTLAGVIANEMGVNIKTTSGPAIEKPGDLAAVLTSLKEGDILFIDEIHRLSHVIEEILYPAMEDYKIDIIIGQGPSAKSIRLDLNHFTLVGATTNQGSLTKPLRDRFGVIEHLDLYDNKSLGKIISRSAGILQVDIEENAVEELAKRSRGTPRIANRLLKRVRDYAQVLAEGNIDYETANTALDLYNVDALGLDETDRKLLRIIIDYYKGGPAGVNAIAAALGEETSTIEDVYEPYLIQQGLLMRTHTGRVVTDKGYKHLGLRPHESTEDKKNAQISMNLEDSND